MDYKDLANLIFPDVKDISYYEEKYPARNFLARLFALINMLTSKNFSTGRVKPTQTDSFVIR